MSFLTYKFRMTLVGLFQSRGLTRNESLVVITTILSQKEAIQAAATPETRGIWGQLLGELEQMRAELVAGSGGVGAPVVQVVAPPPIPEALLGLGTEAELRDVNVVNSLVDTVVTDIFNIVSTFANRKRQDEYRFAGERLFGLWFQESGRRFLAYSGRNQWAETARRFEDLGEQSQRDLETLNLKGFVNDVLALNAWFARLLNIDTTRTEPEDVLSNASPELSVEDQAERLLMKLVCQANVTWPSDDEAQVQARQRVTGPYIDMVQAKSRG